MADAMQHKLEAFQRQAFWQRLGPSQAYAFFLEHIEHTSFPALLTCAHCLMQDMCGSERVKFDDDQTHEHVRAAIVSQFGAQALSLDDKYFNIASCGPYIGIGLGPTAKKRTQTAKLSLAIRVSAATMREFEPRYHTYAALVNEMVMAARAMLDRQPDPALTPPCPCQPSAPATPVTSSASVAEQVAAALVPDLAPSMAACAAKAPSQELGARSCFETQRATHNKIPPRSASSQDGLRGFSLHSKVQINGLRTKAQLNGQMGRIRSLSADRSRWNIQLDDDTRKMVAVKPDNMTSVPSSDHPSSVSCLSVEAPPVEPLEVVWCPTAFQVAQRLDIDHELIFKENTTCDGPFVAFGEIVCSERYILWQAHICSRSFRRVPVNLQKMYEFPHMTLAKLEHGYAERQANKSLWFVDGLHGPEEFDISQILCDLNNSLRRDTTVYRLHAGHMSPNYVGCRYDITGGEARRVFREVQNSLRSRLEILGDRVGFWAEEPACPHITFEYPDDDVWFAQQKCEVESVEESAPTEHSKTSSMEIVLDALDECNLARLKPIFERERISQTVLPTLTDQLLRDAGVAKLGDRQKVLLLATSMRVERLPGQLVAFQ